MPLGASNNSRSYSVRLGNPRVSQFPSILFHQVADGLSNSDWFSKMRRWVYKIPFDIMANPHNDNSGTKLRDSIIRSIEQLNMNGISSCFDLSKNHLAIFVKLVVKKPSHIFKHNSTWLDFIYKPQGFREQVTLIISTQLFSRSRERWTGYTSGQQINTIAIGKAKKIPNVAAYNIPIGSISFQGRTILLLILHQGNMLKSSQG